MFNRHEAGFTLVELMVIVVIIGLLAAVAIPNYVTFQDRAKESRVMQNCHIVQVAAEDFSARNDGDYAADLTSVLDSGETVVDLLPNGNLLINPWSGLASEPIDGAAAQHGETGYQGVNQNGSNVGYIVDGYGRNTTVLRLSNGQ